MLPLCHLSSPLFHLISTLTYLTSPVYLTVPSLNHITLYATLPHLTSYPQPHPISPSPLSPHLSSPHLTSPDPHPHYNPPSPINYTRTTGENVISLKNMKLFIHFATQHEKARDEARERKREKERKNGQKIKLKKKKRKTEEGEKRAA